MNVKHLVLVKARLLHIDNALPLLLALHELNFVDKFIFIIPDPHELDAFVTNKIIWETMNEIGSIRYLISNSWGMVRRQSTNRAWRILRNPNRAALYYSWSNRAALYYSWRIIRNSK